MVCSRFSVQENNIYIFLSQQTSTRSMSPSQPQSKTVTQLATFPTLLRRRRVRFLLRLRLFVNLPLVPTPSSLFVRCHPALFFCAMSRTRFFNICRGSVRLTSLETVPPRARNAFAESLLRIASISLSVKRGWSSGSTLAARSCPPGFCFPPPLCVPLPAPAHQPLLLHP